MKCCVIVIIGKAANLIDEVKYTAAYVPNSINGFQSDGDSNFALVAYSTPCQVSQHRYAFLDGHGRTGVAHIHNIIDMIAKSYEKVKEKLSTTLHFCLHGSAPLKCLATSNDQGKVMSAEARVRVRRVVIGISCTTKNRSNLDSTLQTLLSKRESFELLEAVLFSGTIYDCIPQEIFSHARDICCSLDGSATTWVFWVWRLCDILEFPRVSALVVHQARVVVALV